MQLASHGVPRVVTHFTRQTLHNPSRNIHIPAFVRTPPGSTASGTVRKILQQSRTLLGQFFTHLTAPGTVHRQPSSLLARSLHATARSHGSIRSGLSFPVRVALSRPLQAPFLPRAPGIPRGMTQVGLGTARNFSSTRPIFQNLAQNVPITGRAFWETDWELNLRAERRQVIQKPVKHKTKKVGRKEMMKPKFETAALEAKNIVPEQATTYDAEMQRYFTAPPTPNVTTYLLIPLAPTPTSRVPLPSFPSDSHSLLPLSALANLHTSHAMHSLRVSSLFDRLDTANVWARGVSCSAYSHGPAVRDREGVCTILRVEFAGWTEAEVRGVIGESGTGWCVLDERRTEVEDDETSSIFSDVSSQPGSRDENLNASVDSMAECIDPAKSFVLPTLDFSSSFVGGTKTPCSVSSDTDLFNIDPGSISDTEWDSYSNFSSEAGCDPLAHRHNPPLSQSSSWFGFSSDFTQRATSQNGKHLLASKA